MAKEIVVQGEHYANVDELNTAIDSLTAKLDEVPSESPEHNDLLRHIERLREAAEGSASVSGDDSPTPEPSSEAEPEADEQQVTDEGHTTNIREAFEQGQHLHCPLCGSEVDYAELPPMDETVVTCPNCKGWGQVVRPTKVDGQVWHTCTICQGNGYVDKPGVERPPTQPRAAMTPEAPGAVWNATTNDWDAPPGIAPPWDGATWDRFYGRWS